MLFHFGGGVFLTAQERFFIKVFKVLRVLNVVKVFKVF